MTSHAGSRSRSARRALSELDLPSAFVFALLVAAALALALFRPARPAEPERARLPDPRPKWLDLPFAAAPRPTAPSPPPKAP